METNDWKDIFDSRGGQGSGENWDALRELESIQAEIPELADIDADASSLPTPEEMSNISSGLNGNSSSGFMSGFKGLAIVSAVVMLSGAAGAFVVGKMYNNRADTVHNKVIVLNNHGHDIENDAPIFINAEVEEVPLSQEEVPVYYVEHIMTTPEMERDDLNLTTMEHRDINPLAFVVKRDYHEVTRYTKEYNYKYIHNYKVYNYENRLASYVNPYERNGLEAKYSNYEDYKFYARPYMNYYAYEELLGKALRYLEKGRYREVDLILFSIIKSYPDDQNAWFYSGISSYRQGRYGEAVGCFDQILDALPMVFKPESDWYKTLSLLKSGEEEKGMEKLVHIAKSGGFYQKHARELLAKKKK